MKRNLWLLSIITMSSTLLMVAQTCELCKKAFETGMDVSTQLCKCTQPCDCFDKHCTCLEHGCCTELITAKATNPEEPQQAQPMKSPIIKSDPAIEQDKSTIRELSQENLLEKEIPANNHKKTNSDEIKKETNIETPAPAIESVKPVPSETPKETSTQQQALAIKVEKTINKETNKEVVPEKPASAVAPVKPVPSETPQKPTAQQQALAIKVDKPISKETNKEVVPKNSAPVIEPVKPVNKEAPKEPLAARPAPQEMAKQIIAQDPKKVTHILKPAMNPKQCKQHEKSCAYCHNDKKAKKCTCSSTCHCIQNNCKCIQEGCQCGYKSVKREVKDLTIKTNIPYTLLIKSPGDPDKMWLVANRKIPRWMTIKEEGRVGDSAKFILTATQRGRMKLVIHYIGKNQKKATQVIRYKIMVEKGLPPAKPVAQPRPAPITAKPEAAVQPKAATK